MIIKEIEKIGQFMGFVRGLKKPWKMRATVIPLVDDALGPVPEKTK